MAFRLRLVPVKTNIDFFKLQWITFGASALAVVVSLLSVAILGLNFGVDFKGGTTIRTESTLAVDVGVYRDAMLGLDVGSVTISQVFDPTFRADQHVATIRIEAQSKYWNRDIHAGAFAVPNHMKRAIASGKAE